MKIWHCQLFKLGTANLPYACHWHIIKLLMSFRITSLALGQSYDCPSACEVTLKLGNNDNVPKHYIHKASAVCMIFGMCCMLMWVRSIKTRQFALYNRYQLYFGDQRTTALTQLNTANMINNSQRDLKKRIFFHMLEFESNFQWRLLRWNNYFQLIRNEHWFG